MTNYNYFIGVFIFMLVITIGIISLFLTFNKRKNQLLQEKLEEKLEERKEKQGERAEEAKTLSFDTLSL